MHSDVRSEPEGERDKEEEFPDSEDEFRVEDEGEAPRIRVYELRSATNAKRIRLDLFITRSVENASRSKVQQLIEGGGVIVNGNIVLKPGRLVIPGDLVICSIPKSSPAEIVPENIPLDIVFEDEHVIVVNKPAGMVTHPAYGNYTGTLVNALLYHTSMLSLERGVERAGILHRLDKGTSGLLVAAKTDEAHRVISKQFAAHTVDREYCALVWGRFAPSTGIITAPLGRHRSDRKKMAVIEGGKEAVTGYETLRDFGPLTSVAFRLRTGRTHQIRVHCAHMHHPIFGDPTYGGRRILYGNVTQRYKTLVNTMLEALPRQALHARTIGFIHPASGEKVFFESELPEDFASILRMLEQYAAGE